MIRRIAHEIAERIRERPWADRVAGVVVPYTYKDATGKSISVPVSCDVTGLDCSEEQLVQLLPDVRRRSVIFIEDRSGARRIGDEGQMVKFQGVIRIVGWINPKEMGIVPDCEGCGTAYKISQEIFGLLPNKNANLDDCNITRLNFDHYGYEKTGENPWKQYGLDEDRRKFTLPPFEVFAMDLVCQWFVHNSCLGQVTAGSPIGCDSQAPVRRRHPKDFTCEELLDATNGLTDEQLGPDCLNCGSGSGSGSGGDCDCAPLGYDLHNSKDTVLLSGVITDPCGQTLELEAPDATYDLKDEEGQTLSSGSIPSKVNAVITAPSATVLRDGSPYDTVLSGGSIDVESDCPTPLDSTVQLKDSADVDISTPITVPYNSAAFPVTAPDGTINIQKKDTALANLGLPVSATVKSNETKPVNLPVGDSTVNIQLKNSVGTNIGPVIPVAVKAEGTEAVDVTAPDGAVTIKNFGGTTLGTQAVNSNGAVDYVAPIPLKFGWAAGNGDTLTWTVTTDEAGTYGTYTPTGTNGTITYSKNGGGYAALSGSITLAVSDTITVRRTTTTSAGSVKWGA